MCGFSKCLKELAPQVGLEPTTLRLTAGCSAIELLRSVLRRTDAIFFQNRSSALFKIRVVLFFTSSSPRLFSQP
jgi:hypothetical protein